MPILLVLNGPNLNLLGSREPGHYGVQSLSQINQHLAELATEHAIQFEHFQSNAEHELVDRIHLAHKQSVDFIIINPAAFTHTSIALRDALSAVEIPFIELHLSNVHAREPFRQHSYFSDTAEGIICGFGAIGYELAFRAVLNKLDSSH